MATSPYGPNTPYNPSNPFNPLNLPVGKMTHAQYQYYQQGTLGNIPDPKPQLPVSSDDNQQQTPPASQNGNANVTSTIYPNVLRDFVSFNPVIALQVTNIANYNAMISNQLYDPSKWNTICQSGGVGPAKATGFPPGQTQYFSRDLYIDDVTVNTICGLNQENRGSNATEVDFTITEPYGMDLIEQLYDYCHLALGEKNYCQLPYMLKISFQGFQQDGSLLSAETATKYIPIHLLNMDIKLNNMGATYKVSAIAYNEMADTEKYGRIPSTIEVGTETSPSNANSSIIIGPTVTENSSAVQGGLVHNYTDALAAVLNKIQQDLPSKDITPKVLVPDTYVFQFASGSGIDDIGQYFFLDEIWDDPDNPPVAQDAPMGAPALVGNQLNLNVLSENTLKYAVNHTTGQTGSGAVTYIKGGKVTFNAGSSIKDCLNTLIINSTYVTSQITSYNNMLTQLNTAISASSNPASDTSIQSMIAKIQNTPLNWFTVTTSMQPGPYDAGRQTLSQTIIYTISPYVIMNCRSLSSPTANPITRTLKEYDYMFTGKNTEVLDFQLNFNNAFITYAQFNNQSKTQGTGNKMPDKPQVPPASQTASSTSFALQSASSPQQDGRSTVVISSSNKMAQGVGTITPERNQAADVASTIYSVGDQIELDMTIQGDPDFIKQDGIFLQYNTSNTYSHTGQGKPGGILFNTGEIYANVNFKVPQDLNQTTGTMDLTFNGDSNNYKRNVFSGQYRIMTVMNKFSRGHFTQQLNCIRYNPRDFIVGSTTTTNNNAAPVITSTT